MIALPLALRKYLGTIYRNPPRLAFNKCHSSVWDGSQTRVQLDVYDGKGPTYELRC
jgi:hypothetical protein